jgi:hypothetical protein
MEKMPFTTNGIDHQRRTAAEIIKVGDDFRDSTRVMILLGKFRLASEQAPEETIEMITRGATSSEATIEVTLETTGKIPGQGFRGLSCLPKR